MHSLLYGAVALALSPTALAEASPRLQYRQAGNSSTGAACACAALQSLASDATYLPTSANYTYESNRVWDFRSNTEPACVFAPSTADQVAEAVGVFNRCNAVFAIRGGGHMNAPGSNGINGGVTLALENLDNLSMGTGNSTVNVGPGNRWVDVYSFLDPMGLVAIGGRLKTIGVPGLTLIGGVHYFINKYGYAMDNVVSYNVVLGNGTQVRACNSTNRELFWALKGGVNNFGIVTNFELKTYHVPQVGTTLQTFNESGIRAYTQAICDFVNNTDTSIASGFFNTISIDPKTMTVSALFAGVQEKPENPPSRFANLTAIPGTSKTHNVQSLLSWSSQFDTPLQAFRIQFNHHAMVPEPEQLYKYYELWRSAVKDVADVEGLNPTFVMNSAPKTAATVAKTNGIGNVWGLDDKDSYIWFQLATSWKNAADDQRMEAWGRSLMEYMHSINIQLGYSSEFIYLGDAGEWQEPWTGFGEKNVQRMKDVRAAYDPGHVFTRLNFGGFKLPL